MSAELQFRSAAFGGFQKQDVLDYIEASGREREEMLTALRGELEEAVRDKRELEETLAGVREQKVALLEENEALTASEQAHAQELERLRNELSGARIRAEQAEGELVRLRQELEQVRPIATAYESLKNRTAGIELEAHCRAEGIEADAQIRAEQTREQAKQWLGKLKAEYDRLRENMNDTMTCIKGEMEQAQQILDQISDTFSGQEETLKGLSEMCQSDLPLQPPEPLSLDEP